MVIDTPNGDISCIYCLYGVVYKFGLMGDENWDAIIAELEVNNEEYDDLITDVVADVSISIHITNKLYMYSFIVAIA